MKRKQIIILCAVAWRFFLALGGAACFTEGHPYIATLLLAVAGAAMELKDQLSGKKTTPDV